MTHESLVTSEQSATSPEAVSTPRPADLTRSMEQVASLAVITACQEQSEPITETTNPVILPNFILGVN